MRAHTRTPVRAHARTRARACTRVRTPAPAYARVPVPGRVGAPALSRSRLHASARLLALMLTLTENQAHPLAHAHVYVHRHAGHACTCDPHPRLVGDTPSRSPLIGCNPCRYACDYRPWTAFRAAPTRQSRKFTSKIYFSRGVDTLACMCYTAYWWISVCRPPRSFTTT